MNNIKINRNKHIQYVFIFVLMSLLLISLIHPITNISNILQKDTSDLKIGTSNGIDLDIYSLINSGQVYESDNGSVWNLQGSIAQRAGYEFVDTATDNDYMYILQINGTVYRCKLSTFHNSSSSWERLPQAPPIPGPFVSIAVTDTYIYILSNDGDSFRYQKALWPGGFWIIPSN